MSSDRRPGVCYPIFTSSHYRAFQEAGLLAGPLGVVMVAVLSYFTVCILIR